MRFPTYVLVILVAAALAACGTAGTPLSNGGAAGTPLADGGAAAMAGDARSRGDYGASVERDTAAVRRATAAFRSLDAAVAAGYVRSVPSCLSHPELGGMGRHHANRALLDDRIEVERPEMLLYTRAPSGEYVFHGVEYIVLYTDLPRDARPPTVMGQELKRSDELGLWYRHAWVWTENPSGLFADWNPEVVCR